MKGFRSTRPRGTPLRMPAATGAYDALCRAPRCVTVGDDRRTFVDPTGIAVEVTQALADHILQDLEKRWDGRDAYFPFIPELIEDSHEIRENFARSEIPGRVSVRRKYVRAIRLDKKTVFGLYAELQDRHWVTGDRFRGKQTAAGNVRKGRLLYGRR